MVLREYTIISLVSRFSLLSKMQGTSNVVLAGKGEVCGSIIEGGMPLLVHSPCIERKYERGRGWKEIKKFLVIS